MHGGWVHLLGNIWFLKVFGDRVEARFGRLRFFFLYLLFGILGALCQFVVSPHSKTPIIGASGAIAGVMGAYLCFFPRGRIKTIVPSIFFYQIVTLPAFVMLGYWFFARSLETSKRTGILTKLE